MWALLTELRPRSRAVRLPFWMSAPMRLSFATLFEVTASLANFTLVTARAPIPQSERINPTNVRDMQQEVQDAARVFTLFFDRFFVSLSGSYHARKPIIETLDRVIGPDDLVGVMTPEMSPSAITFSRKTTSIEKAVTDTWYWGTRDSINAELPQEQAIRACYPGDERLAGEMIARMREQHTLDALEGLVVHLEGLRPERKFVLVFTEGWPLYRANPALARTSDGRVPTGDPLGTDPRTGEKGIFVKNYLPIPKANSALRELANGTITGSGSGCLYTGPTRITLRNDGKYDVVSPRTVSTKPGCGPGTAIAIPQNGVIYVQNVFPYGSGDPNANPLSTSPCSYKNTGSGAPWLACGTPNAAGVTYPPGLPVPLKDDKTNDSSVEKYIHTNGDLFISGTLKGRLTVGAQNDIVVVEDVRYSDTGPSSTDILGMIPQNSVKVFHPVNKNTGANIGSTWSDGNATIYAAMLAISRSISVQNYNQGNPLGLLSVRGVMAQKYRGIVGTSSGGTPVSGFAKDYLYDGRLQVQSPPHFLDPVRTAWEVKTWAEVDTPPEHKSGT